MSQRGRVAVPLLPIKPRGRVETTIDPLGSSVGRRDPEPKGKTSNILP